MNDLKTQQIVLLCLLVSFVTAVTTGITTVSLLGQTPEPVSQTINRIVERTVETIIETPENPKEPKIERVVETVVVNQEDLTVEAVSNNSKSFVRIYGLDKAKNRFFVGLGIVIEETGKILTSGNVSLQASSFVADYREGTFNLGIIEENNTGISLFKPIESGDTKFAVASFGSSQNLKLAQTVIVLSGKESNSVATGIVTGLVTVDGEVSAEDVTAESVPSKVLTQIDTSINPDKILSGSILMNLKGEIVGMKVGSQTLASSFAPIDAIKVLLNN